ncbi:MAG: hypothetical protein AAFO63_14155, partial [Pseudomonadota bacterium]
RQDGDGSWLCDYGNAVPMRDRLTMSRDKAPQARDTNFSAYCAVGVLHFAMCFDAIEQVRRYWPMVARAMDFVISLQSPSGDISWSKEAAGTNDVDDALIAGNASIYMSLNCAAHLGRLLGYDVSEFDNARHQLGTALRTKPARFNRRTNQDSGFAMDWYYPVLSGVLTGDVATKRIDARWDQFVSPSRGCHCVLAEPWITVAETCELVLALLAVGRRQDALQLFEQQSRYRDTDGAYWMGWQYDERIFWPMEKPSWTQAAVILAGDALYGISTANQLMIHQNHATLRNTLKVATASTDSNSPDAKASS